MILTGEAVAKWTESSGSSKTQTTFSGHECLLDTSFYIFGSKDSDCDVIAAGAHTYAFEYQLPPTLPYSIEGKYGHVKYSVKANLDIPWAFDLQDERNFIISRDDDVNLLIDCNLPVEIEEVKTFCCWCCKSDPVTLTVRLPKSGFVAGDRIPVNIQIHNRSSKNVGSSLIELKRIHRFHSHDPIKKVKEHEEMVVELTSRGAENGENVNFEVLVDLESSIPITNEKFCKTYQICYELKIIAITEGLSTSPQIAIPICIGRV